MFCLVEVQQSVLVQITTSWIKKSSPKSTLTHGRASTLVWKNDENFMSTSLPICLTEPVPVTCLLNATFSKEAKQSISLEIFEKDNIIGDGVIYGLCPHRLKRHSLVASCQFYRLVETFQQVATNLSISSSCNKSVKIRIVAICHLQTC